MSVISITIEESEEQIISGIPKYVILSTSIPSTIFYTFDGIDPTTASNVYLGGNLSIPTDGPSANFKLFAKSGTDSSSIITKVYSPNIIHLRKTHGRVHPDQVSTIDPNAIFPYGERGSTIPVSFGPIASSDIIDSSKIPNTIIDGYDNQGSPVMDIDRPLDEYSFIFSETNEKGERGHGIGTLPENVKIRPKAAEVETSKSNTLFNPKAKVIFQDSRDEPIDPNICLLNRQFFSFGDQEIIRNGSLLGASEKLSHTGSFLKYHFNKKTNEMTYYYHDSKSLKWIISTEPFIPKASTGLWNTVRTSNKPGAQFIYKWYPFKKTILY